MENWKTSKILIQRFYITFPISNFRRSIKIISLYPQMAKPKKIFFNFTTFCTSFISCKITIKNAIYSSYPFLQTQQTCVIFRKLMVIYMKRHVSEFTYLNFDEKNDTSEPSQIYRNSKKKKKTKYNTSVKIMRILSRIKIPIIIKN